MIAREIKDQKTEIKLLNNLGDAKSESKDEQKAIAYYQQALQVAQESKDRNLERYTLTQIGVAYGLQLVNWQQSIVYYQSALVIARETKNRDSEGELLSLLGMAYNYIGNLPKGIETLQQAVAIARETQNLKWEGLSLANLAAAYLAQGDTQKGTEFGQQALSIARGERSSKNGQKIKDREMEGLALVYLGTAYFAGEDNYQKAIELTQQGLAIVRESKNRFLELKQRAFIPVSSSSTKHLTFTPYEIISQVARFCTLPLTVNLCQIVHRILFCC